jgi:hypothetical protein
MTDDAHPSAHAGRGNIIGPGKAAQILGWSDGRTVTAAANDGRIPEYWEHDDGTRERLWKYLPGGAKQRQRRYWEDSISAWDAWQAERHRAALAASRARRRA